MKDALLSTAVCGKGVIERGDGWSATHRSQLSCCPVWHMLRAQGEAPPPRR